MAQRSSVASLSWKVPSTILVSFVTAILLAAGHHWFYQSLDGTLVRQAAFSQQFNIGIGTAFAFLVRALLVLSIGTTYWQIFWRTLRSNTLSIGKIDTLFGLLDNVFKFFKVSTLYQHPFLVSIALLAWTVPIAMIVPPATLSVRSESIPSYELKAMDVPLFDNTMSMAQISRSTGDRASQTSPNDNAVYHGCDYDATFLLYESPSVALSRMTMATAYQGVLPNVAQPAVNSSYTLSFKAPATRCVAAPKSVLSKLGVGEYYTGEGRPNKWYSYEYLSWAPSKSFLVPDNVKGKFLSPYLNTQQNRYKQISGLASNSSDGLSDFFGQYQDLPPSLFIAYAWKPPNDSFTTWDALNCSFYDANYTVHFKFPDGNQTVDILSVDLLENPLKISAPIWNNCTKGGETGTILTTKEIGYQALIESLGRALVGTMAFEDGLHKTSNLVVDQTSALRTNLAYSNELAWMYAVGEDVHEVNGVETVFSDLSIGTASVPKTNMTVAATIEQLFHNMTLSLFSDKSMLSQGPSNTNVTTTSSENVYSYAWTQLVLAYGVAIAVTLITVIVGCIILFANGAAYSNDFSTFLRLVRGQHIDNVVAAYDDQDGADPLPKALSKARIHIAGAGEQASEVSRKGPPSHHSSTAVDQAEWSGMLNYSSTYGAHS